jgi:LacI family transcriptional regulator, galactose operon repressor
LTTIKQIADRANASYSAVSRALNGKKGVNPELRKTIIEIAKQMNYFPHSSAQALVQKRIGVLGVIITRTSEFAFQNPFYTHMLMGISHVAQECGYQIMLAMGEQSSYAAMCHRRQVDGVVVVANRLDDILLTDLIEQQIPAVAVPGLLPDAKLNISSVNSENYESISQALQYLIDLGHRRIAFITGQMNSLYTVERVSAYRKVLEKNNISLNPDYICESDFSKTDGFRLMGILLGLEDKPTAVICMNDVLVPGAMQQIYQHDMKIPQEISVIGIGCSENFEHYFPPLTAVRTQVKTIGQRAAQILIQQVENDLSQEEHVLIESELIIRGSTAPPP